MNMQMEKVSEQKLDQLAIFLNDEIKLTIGIRNLSQSTSIFAQSPVNYNEGRAINEDLDDLKTAVSRFKRVLGNIALFLLEIENLINFKYPKLSYISMIIMCLLILLIDLNNILPHILWIILVISVCHHPLIKVYLSKYEGFIFNEKNPNYYEPLLFTKEEWDFLKWSKALEKTLTQQKSSEPNQINNGNNDDFEDEKVSIVQSYKAMKKSIYDVVVMLTNLANLMEKLQNLITWRDPIRTKYMCIFIFLVFYFLYGLPLRFILFVGCIDEFRSGKKVYQKRRQYNMLLGQTVIQYIFKKAHLELTDFVWTSQWPKALKKTAPAQIGLLLQLHLNEDIVVNIFNTPKKLKEAISTVNWQLKLKENLSIKYRSDPLFKELKLKTEKPIKTSKKVQRAIIDFIYNIPSDYYRLLNPQLI